MVKNNFDKTKKYQIGFVRAEKKSTKFKNKDGGITQPSFSRTPQSIIIPGSALLEKAADFSEYLSKNPDNLPTEVIFSLYEFQPDGSLKYVDKGSPLAHQSLGDLPKEEPIKDDNSDLKTGIQGNIALIPGSKIFERDYLNQSLCSLTH